MEAKFFLEKLRSTSPTTIDFRHYVSAIVSALYGSLQHLLYDYAHSFWPNIDESDYLDPRLFRLLAKSTNNSDALAFIKWYDGLPARINQNDAASIIWNVRRTETHRANTPFEYRLELFDAVNMSGGTGSNISGHIEVSVYGPGGGARPTPYFRENPSRSVEEVIASTISFIESLISEAEVGFPIHYE